MMSAAVVISTLMVNSLPVLFLSYLCFTVTVELLYELQTVKDFMFSGMSSGSTLLVQASVS